MALTPRDRLDREIDKLTPDRDGFDTDTCRRLEHFAAALDGEVVRRKFFDPDGNEKTFEPRSIEAYVQCLRLSVDRGLDILACNAEGFNDFIDSLHDERGLSKPTLARYQSAAVAFYRYHDDLEVDPEAIHIYSERSQPRHDELDMFEPDEVEALRDACEKPRDRALLEMLIYTGQRITALRTLRVGDVDLEKGYFYLNDEADGLKGALARGRKRPLFGARKFVRDWLQYHPNGDDPDAPLFVGEPSHWKTKLDEPWSEPGVRQCLKRMAERAGVDKPVNPHNFKHYFVTVMKREYNMDDDTLRMLLGATEDSTILSTTYSHVTDGDYIEKAETTLGYTEANDDGQTLTPETCPDCGEVLESHWNQCPVCGSAM